MSRKTKIFEEVIGLIGREVQSSRNREALEESGRRLLAQLEGREKEQTSQQGDGEVPARKRRPAVPGSLGSRVVGAVALLAGGLGLLAVVLLALFAFLAAPGMNLAYSEWLLTATVPVSVLAALPALWLSIRGVAGMFRLNPSPEAESLSEEGKEKELLGAMERRGELTPARAAMETTLTVAEADRMLGEFAQKGYLVARVSGGNLVYALWDEERRTPDGERTGENQGEHHLEEGTDDRYPEE